MSGTVLLHLSTQVSGQPGHGSDHKEGRWEKEAGLEAWMGAERLGSACLRLLTRVIAHVSVDCQAGDVESLNDVAVPLLSIFNVV